MQLVRNIFASSNPNPDQQQQQAGILASSNTPQVAPLKASSAVKSDAEKVFEHMCPANSLTIQAQYLLQALYEAELIDKAQVNIMHLQIEGIMQTQGRKGSKRDLLQKDGPTVNTKYMNQAQLAQHNDQQRQSESNGGGPFDQAGQQNQGPATQSNQFLAPSANGGENEGPRRKSHSVKPLLKYELTLTQFTALVNEMKEETRQKLFFNFKRILSPQQLQAKQEADIAKFRKRNNPSEEDAPMLAEEFSSGGKAFVPSAKDKSDIDGQGQDSFGDIVPIVDAPKDGAGGFEDFMEFEAIDVANDVQAGQGQRVPQIENIDKDELSERLSAEEQLDLSRSKNFFVDEQIKSSRRYLYENMDAENQEFENLKELSHEQDNLKVDHTNEIEQDIMPANHSRGRNVNETEQSEFRKLPQLESFESDQLQNAKGSNRQNQKQGDMDEPLIISTQADNMFGLVNNRNKESILDSKAFFSRQQHRTLLSSVEFHSGIKEIQQKQSVVQLTENEQPAILNQDQAAPSSGSKVKGDNDQVSLDMIQLVVEEQSEKESKREKLSAAGEGGDGKGSGPTDREKGEGGALMSDRMKKPEPVQVDRKDGDEEKVPLTPQTPMTGSIKQKPKPSTPIASTTGTTKGIKANPHKKNTNKECCCVIF